MADLDNQNRGAFSATEDFHQAILDGITEKAVRVAEMKEMLDGISSEAGVSQLKERLDEAQEKLKDAERELRDVILRS